MKTEEYLDFCTAELAPVFRRFEAVERVVFRRVQEAFRRERVQQSDFMGSTGYGYGDVGRDKLGRVFARAFECEDALVRPQIMSGTHAISTALFGLLRHGDTMLCVSGEPYDTLKSAISAFPQFGIHYEQTELIHSGLDYESIKNRLAAGDVKMVYAQRSRGYASRRSLLPDELGRLAQLAHGIDKNIIVMVDNCYGEFVLEHEPTYYGADVIAGSLIKNAGGGLAPTGGYIAGKREYVETAAERLTVPGIGREIGSYEAGLRLFYQGLFIAPHTVCEALKNAALIALALYGKGYRVSPAADEARSCIVQSVRLGDAETVKAFCAAVQASSPVDAFAVPEPWDMPGYSDKVIMAAGTFVAGSSIEFSADAPLREPYSVYLQGGLTSQQGYIFLERFFGLLDN